ncbi:MAG: hypothetical protein NVSMB9_20480 [Isosphaeraceae bacterium]
MADILQTHDRLTLVAPPIELAFDWDGARWSHRLDVGGQTIAASLEWEPGRDDPSRVVSPAYQQATAQESDEGPRALLVGQWGPNHGSAVFLLSEGPDGVVVAVDVAVRTRARLDALSSTYNVARTSSDLIDAGPESILWSLEEPPGGRLSFEPGSPASGAFRVGLAEAGPGSTRVQAEARLSSAATQRLCYHWRWTRDASVPDRRVSTQSRALLL